MRTPGSDLTLHKLEVFRLTAELESVSLAAERLGLAQPVVTAHIRSLERKLGVRLTARHGRAHQDHRARRAGACLGRRRPDADA